MAQRRRRQAADIITALIYTRVSKEDQARDGLSLPAQLQACRRYAAERGWLIAGEHQDILTGKRDDRESYQRLLSEARRLATEGRSVAVIVMRLDRFGRRLEERVQRRKELKELGVETHSVREGGLVNDLMANLLAVLAEEEVERLGDRIRDTREHNVLNGWHVPGRPAWGLRLRPATEAERRQGAPKSVLAVDEMTAPYVREVFRRVATGEATPRAVALWVAGLPDEARGFVCKQVTREVDGKLVTEQVKTPRVLCHSAVRWMLTAPVYAGRFEANEDGVQERGRWEALIDDATWEAVQRRLARSSGRSGPVSGNHLLSGILRCPRPGCGAAMNGWTQAGRWKRYRCNSFTQGGERAVRNCKETAGARGIDTYVIGELTALVAPLANADPIVLAAIGREWERIRTPNDAPARERAQRIAKAKRAASAARRRLAEVARQLVDGTVSRTAYSALAAEEERRLEAAERQLAEPELAPPPSAGLPPWETALAEVGGWARALAGETVPEQREAVVALIDHVVPVRISHGKFRAEIFLTLQGRALKAAAEQYGKN